MPPASEMVKIGFRDEDGDVETLWATPLQDSFYRLENSTYFQYGVSWEDVVEAMPDEKGILFFSRVVEKSGNRTLRIDLQSIHVESKEAQAILQQIENLGCTYELAIPCLVVVTVPPEVRLEKVATFFRTKKYCWEYADPPRQNEMKN